MLVNPEEAIIFVSDYVDANAHILNCAYDSMGRDEMKRFFYADFFGVIMSIIERFEKEKDIVVTEHYKLFVANFYTEALSGILIDYFQHKDKRNRDEIIQYTLQILKKSIPNIL